MQPLSAIPPSFARALRGVAFDLDDTLLDHGKLLPEALAALYRLAAAGLELYAVTGRPAGWGSVVVRQWPLAGAVSENGSIAFENYAGRIRLHDWVGDDERRERRQRLARIVTEIRRRHPELQPSDDMLGRLSDFTFDIGEHERVPAALVTRARASAAELGAASVASSVHLHVTLDRSDKASGVVRLIQHLRALDPSRILTSYAFVGDSENDAACFAAFRLAIGVKNLSGRPTLPPRFLASRERAAGFVEAADALLAAR